MQPVKENLGDKIFHPSSQNNTTYRFYLFPLAPDASVAVTDGQLRFRYQERQHGYNYKTYTSSFFNIQGLVAYDYASLKKQFQAREMNLNKNMVVVDVEKTFFDEHVNVQHKDYAIVPLIYPPKAYLNFQEGWGMFTYEIDQSPLPYPFFAQTNTLVLYMGGVSSVEVSNKLGEKFPEPQLKIYDYTDQKVDLGQDMFITSQVPIRTTSHLREHKQTLDWVSNTNKNINKKSYSELTHGTYEFAGNAEKIAALYEDYATKGEGFSAFIHFHWFRHKANILQAKIIAKGLREQYKEADNFVVADYLVEQFNDLKDKHPVNEKGSFARRTDYAILQLTNGLCENVAEYQQYRQQQHIQQKQP